ncbi:hypothetical protein [Streptomyces sp. NBC_00038]|uniref:hypothetical protein n=1 Tax=Streptomyces sp. NBC_00038 TaxID=2903615 RepID=UPI00224CF6BE|nr:hypothetical protein [Streptomyces sp. NBC_00038]MCX5554874.1 hypothetical protein [Streptomyces sp. NBC_00038]
MSAPLPVTVAPPSPKGGRRVRVNGESLGVAYSLEDLSEFLRRAGLDVDPVAAAASPLIDWRGVGPECWSPEARS